MEHVLISACLLGMQCRYDGQSKPIDAAVFTKLQQKYHLIPVCPEVYGGLATPRAPAERVEDRVMTAAGVDVTQAYLHGATQTLRLAQLFGCRMAILKQNSPSCGAGMIYDGSWTHHLTRGDGVTAALLMANGIRVIGESELESLV